MRLRLLFPLVLAVCTTHAEARPFHWPWSKAGQQQAQEHQQLAAEGQQQATEAREEKKRMRLFPLFSTSRSKEQQRLNAVMSPKPTTREEQVMKPDYSRQFNLNAAKLGGGYLGAGKPVPTNSFAISSHLQTKNFATGSVATKDAWGTKSVFGTKSVPVKESWFARRTAFTKSYATQASRDANKGLTGGTPMDADRKFVARGRRQAEFDADRAEGRAPKIPLGAGNDLGQSWRGDAQPLSIQDVKNLLNKN